VIIYFDTSALVKRYVAEAGSEVALTLWESATVLAASQILYAEMTATFARKRREQPGSAVLLDQAQQAFRDDWEGMHRIPVDDAVNRRVDVLLSQHPLRGADSIHLASALLLRDLVQDQVTFACADSALVAAAKHEGLLTAP
jgi:predicted nucleic acid-binding protein